MREAAGTERKSEHRLDWRKRMSDTVAYGLLVYTALQIFVTMHAIQDDSESAAPMLALVLLVAAIIPLYRRFERRWEAIGESAAADPAFARRFRQDWAAVWLISAVLPLVLAALFTAMSAMF